MWCADGEHRLSATDDRVQEGLNCYSEPRRDHRTREQRLEPWMANVEDDQRIDDVVDQFVEGQVLDLGSEDGLRLAQSLDEAIGERLGYGVLVGEELVERAGRDAGAGGNGIGGGGVEADLGEHQRGDVQQQVDAALAACLSSAWDTDGGTHCRRSCQR